jgi:hypothetical protein
MVLVTLWQTEPGNVADPASQSASHCADAYLATKHCSPFRASYNSLAVLHAKETEALLLRNQLKCLTKTQQMQKRPSSLNT